MIEEIADSFTATEGGTALQLEAFHAGFASGIDAGKMVRLVFHHREHDLAKSYIFLGGVKWMSMLAVNQTNTDKYPKRVFDQQKQMYS